LTKGKVHAGRSEYESALDYFREAGKEAEALNMRPTIWQSQVEAAKVLESRGRVNEAREMRASARVIVEEIAGMFTDDELRSAYIESALSRVDIS
jgi:ATP/maltotriose-dependent transcriptional regulator MalT